MTTTIKDRPLLGVEDIVTETGLSRSTINRLMSQGTLTRVKVGRVTRVTGESYRRWLNSLTENAA